MADQELLTVDQAAAEFGIHRTTLYRAIGAGSLPPHRRMGDRRTYVDRSDVERLVDSPAVRRCLELVYREFTATGEWPRVADLQRRLEQDRDAFDLALALDSLPRELGWRVRDLEGRAELTIRGIARCDGSGADLAAFVNVVRACYEKYQAEGDDLTVTGTDLAKQFGFDDLLLEKVYRLVQLEGIFWQGMSRLKDSWSILVDDKVRYFRDVRSIGDYFTAKQALIEAFAPARTVEAADADDGFVRDPSDELHPAIAEAIGDLLVQGNGTSAVMAAAAAFERLLAQRIGVDEQSGVRLISTYFEAAARSGVVDARRVEALQSIARGAFRAFRNQVAHGEAEFIGAHAREIVGLFSLLAREVEALPVAPRPRPSP